MRIKDIAKLAGVSPATVSRVMNNNGYVKEDKRKAVLEVIEAVGYQPNEIAKSLKNQKSRMIGVIVPKISTETSSRYVEGITKIAKEHQYQIIIANTNLDIEEEINYLKFLSNRLVDGIIMLATEVTDRHRALIHELSVPIVVIAQEIDGVTTVTHDNYQATYELTQYLIDHHHQAIAFIGVDEKDRAVGQVRKQAFFACLAKHQIAVNQALIGIGNFDIESGYHLMKDILKHGKPTAVLAVTDHLAIGAMHALYDEGLSVPEDVSIVGIGDIKLAAFLNPPLTTIHHMFKTSGEMATRALFEKMENPSTEVASIVTGYKLQERKSVRSLI